MKVGAEPGKLVLLGALVALGAYVLFTSGDDTPRQRAARATPAGNLQTPVERVARTLPEANGQRDLRRGTRAAARGTIQEFKPTLKPKRPEDRVDPMTVDPTLRLELLARLKNVKTEGGMRSLFEFSQPPPPKPDIKDVKVVPKPLKVGPELPPVAAKPPAPAPKATVPIPLKFYGFSSPRKQGVRRAFFLDGDEIWVAGEGDTIKKRYQVVRIGVNSVVMKDIEQDSQQTLPLVEEQQS